jgi:hypothetical protein
LLAAVEQVLWIAYPLMKRVTSILGMFWAGWLDYQFRYCSLLFFFQNFSTFLKPYQLLPIVNKLNCLSNTAASSFSWHSPQLGCNTRLGSCNRKFERCPYIPPSTHSWYILDNGIRHNVCTSGMVIFISVYSIIYNSKVQFACLQKYLKSYLAYFMINPTEFLYQYCTDT